jgi:hypothetical protein
MARARHLAFEFCSGMEHIVQIIAVGPLSIVTINGWSERSHTKPLVAYTTTLEIKRYAKRLIIEASVLNAANTANVQIGLSFEQARIINAT